MVATRRAPWLLLSPWLMKVLVFEVSGQVNNQAKLRIRNESSRKVTLNWIHPDTGGAVKMNDLMPQSGFNLDTFVGHKFEFIENPSERTGECTASPDKICKVVPYMVEKNADMCKFLFCSVVSHWLELRYPKHCSSRNIWQRHGNELLTFLRCC